MADKHYVGTIGTVIDVDCGEDISTSTKQELRVRKPNVTDETEVIWDGDVFNNNFIRYTVIAGDWDQAGMYALQSYVEIDAWKGRGETVFFRLFDSFAPTIG